MRPRECQWSSLVPQSEFLDDRAISVDVRPLHVVEQAATRSDHLQQPAAAVMVLLVRPEVLGEVVDALREEGHLHARRTGVGLVRLVLLERRSVVESHVYRDCLAMRGGLSVAKLVEHGNLADLAAHVTGRQFNSRPTRSRTPISTSLN